MTKGPSQSLIYSSIYYYNNVVYLKRKRLRLMVVKFCAFIIMDYYNGSGKNFHG